MKIRVFSKSDAQSVLEISRSDLSMECAGQSFCLCGAAVGVNVVCSAKPSSVNFGHADATLIFESFAAATEFAEALQTASALVDELNIRALD